MYIRIGARTCAQFAPALRIKILVVSGSASTDMPLPVHYIDSHEYLEGEAVAQRRGDGDLPQAASLPILEIAVSSGKLQALSVHNLANVIRQLGSLAKHAESVMGDIADTLASYQLRTVHLEERTKRLRDVLPTLDADREGDLNYGVVELVMYHTRVCYCHNLS